MNARPPAISLPWLLCGLALLSAGSAASAADRFDLGEKTLDNGLRVVALEDHSCPVVAVQVWYHVGSKDEQPDRTGFAHMFEHMMFRGTDRLGPEDHMRYINAVGGECNAYTAFDQTVYIQKVPKDQLDMVLWLEAERMASLRVDEEGFATERAVVEEERRLGLNKPYGSLPEKLLAKVFREHPYRWSPIGNIEHLRAATSEELLRFWETYYVPNNAVLVIVGDITKEQAFASAERSFGWIPRCEEPPRVEIEEPLRDEPLSISIDEDRGPLPVIAVAFRTVRSDHPDALALEMLMSILGGGESSRLYRSVVDEKGAAVVCMAGAFAMEQVGVAAAGAAVMPFGDTGEALRLIESEIGLVRESGVTKEELAKAKTGFLRSLVNESMTVESKAGLVGDAYVFHNGADYLNGRANQIEQMSIDDLKRVADMYLIESRRITVEIKPSIGGLLRGLVGGLMKGGEGAGDEGPGAEGGKGGDKPDASHASEVAAGDDARASTMAERRGPKAHAQRPDGYPESVPIADPSPAPVPMDYVSRTLENGLTVVVIENHEVPLISASIRLTSGAHTDPVDRPGVAAMAAAMATRGSQNRDTRQIADELETHGISLQASAGMDSMTLSGSAVTPQLGRLARMLSEATLQPTFPIGEFEKQKKQVLAGLAVSEKEPASIADRELRRALYGDHFYRRDAAGTAADVRAIDPDQCREWWARNVRPNQATLYFSGDIDPDTAFEVAEGFFDDWAAGELAGGNAPAAPPKPAPTHILLIDTPGAIQSQIRVGQLGIERSDPRYAAGYVMSRIFGGSFGSRLNKTLRIDRGLTYGARGGLRSARFGGRLEISTFSKTPSTAEAVAAILEEVHRLRDEPPSEEELNAARSNILASLAGDLETPQAIASELWDLKLMGLDAADLDQFLIDIANTTASDVTRVAREVVDPDHLIIVVTGDAAAISEELGKIAPVTVLDEDGQPKGAEPKVGG